MKALKMNKVLGSMRRKNNSNADISTHDSDPQGDGPEATAARSVRSFCESSGPNGAGDEVTYLPSIVESAESSPSAAAECARVLRKYLKKDYWSKPSYQYNAIMLIRILTDNPGPTFTRNLDQKFVDTCKEILKSGRDLNVRNMLMETLDSFENTKGYDEGLGLLIEMWKKEKEKAFKQYGGRPPPGPRTMNAPPLDPHSQNYFARAHSNRRLPDPVELASRLEEAKTSAQVLTQTVTHTPPQEVLSNELIKEFADRCQSASRSIQLYMVAENPAPDNDTMESLIDVNEQLQQAMSLHQRSILNARKAAGLGERGEDDLSASRQNGNSHDSRRSSPGANGLGLVDPPAPAIPPRQPAGSGKGKGRGYDYESSAAGPSRSQNHTPGPEEDPFRDPESEVSSSRPNKGKDYIDEGIGSASATAPAEPYHPGYQSTPSYVHRQESALGKETMHGAVTRGGNREEDGDIYDAPPGPPPAKESTYRY